MVALTLFWILQVYMLVLLVRVLLSWVPLLNQGWTPRGVVLVVVESVYFVTDPPLKLLRSFIKPVRMGAISLDLGVLVLFLVIYLLRSFVLRIPF
ncbi:YggT family protein [Arachnia propionica]|uniref:YggT family protein n=1 Tax=Arachnia propionica TaxID=1750 RepID=UPI000F6C2B17|nr:YggT family protein [Arachnia propionica]VEJ58958.1 YGGT family [Arachnia propionica]